MDLEPHKTIRTFIACPIPMAISQKISLVQDQLKAYHWNVKWVPVSNMHLTLSFLGNIQPSMKQKIIYAIDPLISEQKPVRLFLGNMGVFPNTRRPNVLWIGLNGDIGPLMTFQKRLQDALKHLGISENKRHFKAHLTLGRIKGPIPKNQLAKALCLDITEEKNQFICDRLVFYQSQLSSKGAQYSILHEWHF